MHCYGLSHVTVFLLRRPRAALHSVSICEWHVVSCLIVVVAWDVWWFVKHEYFQNNRTLQSFRKCSPYTLSKPKSKCPEKTVPKVIMNSKLFDSSSNPQCSKSFNPQYLAIFKATVNLISAPFRPCLGSSWWRSASKPSRQSAHHRFPVEHLGLGEPYHGVPHFQPPLRMTFH